MNVNLEEANEFANFTKKARLRMAEKRAKKGKRPFLGIGKKQLKKKQAQATPEPEPEEVITVPASGGDYPNVVVTEPTQVNSDIMLGGNVQQAGFFGKNKKTLLIVGGLIGVSALVYFGLGKKLGIR